jgi:hypothetical protein
MSSYRLVIEEIAGAGVMTSYTREAENREVYLTFSPRFERIWSEYKKRLLDHMAPCGPALHPAALFLCRFCVPLWDFSRESE